MTSTLALLFVLAMVLFLAYSGLRDGVFFSTYALARNFVAFLFAMTFTPAMSKFLEAMLGGGHPAPQYYRAISFATILGVVYVVGRLLKVHYAEPEVRCLGWVDRIGGPIVGVLNAVVFTGAVLVLWSMLPFAKYLPGNWGNAHPSALDTGSAVLRVYDHMEERMGGNAPFLIHDEPIHEDLNGNGRVDPGDAFVDLNGNGQWDRGWLWHYEHHATITTRDIERIPGVEAR